MLKRRYYCIHTFLQIPFIIQKRLLLRCMHHFISDLINNLDHMHISGAEPSSVILSQTKLFKICYHSVIHKERVIVRDICFIHFSVTSIVTNEILFLNYTFFPYSEFSYVICNGCDIERLLLRIDVNFQCDTKIKRTTNIAVT